MTGSRVGVAVNIARKDATTIGRVVAADGVARQRIMTGSRVGAAGTIAKQCLKAVGRVVGAGGEAKERRITLSGIFASVAAVRRWSHRVRFGHKPDAKKCKR